MSVWFSLVLTYLITITVYLAIFILPIAFIFMLITALLERN